jgi:hypothetical protein
MDINDINRRLDKLESKNRRFKITFYLMITLILSMGFIGFQMKTAIPKVIEAEKFVVRDPESGVLGYFGFDRYEDPRAEREVTDMVLKMNLGKILITDNGKSLEMSPYAVTLGNKTEKSDKFISLFNNPNPGLMIENKKDSLTSEVLSLQANKFMLGIQQKLTVNSKNQKTMPYITISKELDFKPSVTLFDENGNMRAVLGSAIIRTKGGQIVKHPESTLILFDDKGNVTFTTNR